MMNHRLQVFPKSGAHESKPSVPRQYVIQAAEFEDPRFFRSWLVYDAGLEPARASGGYDWYAALGLALSLSLSVGFWIAAGWLLTRMWR